MNYEQKIRLKKLEIEVALTEFVIESLYEKV